MDTEKGKERCKELIKEEHRYWIGLTNQEAIETVLNELEKKDKEIEHQIEKRNNQKKELAILNEKQKELNKLINTVKSYKGMYKKQQYELDKKEAVINEMAEMINNHDIEEDVCKQMGKNRHCNDFIVSERNCINCIKEYFTNKAENVGE